MKILAIALCFASALSTDIAIPARTASSAAVEVKFDRTEAEAALAILQKQADREPVDQADWQRLFTAVGYRRLKAREAAMGRAFTDGEFKAFMETPRSLDQIAALRRTLDDWSSQPIDVPARAALAYLPADARLKATVFPMIKPKPNEFVFDVAKDPAVFLYLAPGVSGAKARNTMVHELHHIGLGSVCPRPSAKATSDVNAVALREWIPAFGEGLAMLAAAGGPDVHPHAASAAEERDEWDRNVAQFDRHLAEQNAFFLRILEANAGDEAAIKQKMMAYFGVQGPWYTVGWKMAVVIETRLGRKRAIDAFCDPGQLLATYNQAARLNNQANGTRLPLWNSRLAESLAR